MVRFAVFTARLLTILFLVFCDVGYLLAATHQIIAPRRPSSLAKLQPIGRLSPSTQLILTIGLPLRHQGDLDSLLRRLYDPASGDYRQFLTPDQFAKRFGPTEADYAAVIDFARSNQLAIVGQHPNRTLLDVRGTVADIEKTFHVTLQQYRHPTEARTFYFPDVAPSLDLDVPVLSIAGLDNYVMPRPKNLRARPAGSERNTTTKIGSGPGGTYMGKDFRLAYAPGVSLNGAGQSVGLVEFEGYYLSDIGTYETQAQISNVVLTNILINGCTGVPDGNALSIAEVSADIELAISMAPGLSSVLVYEVSPASNYADDLLNRMATDNAAKQLSSSWNFATDPNIEQIFQQFAAQGQSFFDASGDVGAYTGPIPNPDDDPYITIVGGTALMTDLSGAWSSETTWNNGAGDGSSGGVSEVYPIPLWQQGVSMASNGGSTTMRNIPDVAMAAENIEVRYDGTSGAFDGTSCAAPLWAGFMALVNQQASLDNQPSAGFINPAIYWIGNGTNYTNCFHDITSGNNATSASDGLFQAVTGYDLCTGWGTPTGSNLIQTLAVPDPLQVSPRQDFIAGGVTGGPFSPSAVNLVLTNIGAQSVTWNLSNSVTWVSLTSTNGTLQEGEGAELALSLNTQADNLPAGVYTNEVTILNESTGFLQYRQLTLTVVQSLVQNGGFETGNFSDWNLSGNAGGVFISTNVAYVHSGTYGAKLGPATTLGYLSQTVPTIPGQSYLLSLWVDSPDGGAPNEFLVSWNGKVIFDQANLAAIGWTNLQFLVGASASTSMLEFGFRDDPSYLGLDDVTLSSAPMPTIDIAAQSPGMLTLSWSAQAGLGYQLQYTTNLEPAFWQNLGPVMVTNGTAVAETPAGMEPSRFYRVQLLP